MSQQEEIGRPPSGRAAAADAVEPVSSVSSKASIPNARRVGIVLIAGSALAIGACGPSAKSGDPDRSAKLDRGEVAKAAVAPDGTTLWVAQVSGRRVYFASSGAHWSETHNCGKNCWQTKHYDVPTPTTTQVSQSRDDGE